MEDHRKERVDVNKEARRILKATDTSGLHIDKVVRKAIEEANGERYTIPHGKPDQNRGLRKEVEDGAL